MAAFGAAISEHPDPAAAVGEVVGTVAERIGVAPDIALVFVSGHAPDRFDEIAGAVRALLAPGVLIGSTAKSVIGGELESEDGAAVSLWAGRVGAADSVRLETIRAPEGTAIVGMPDDASVGERTLILLAEPYSFPAEAFLTASNTQYPGLSIVGGVASAPGGPGTNRIVVDGTVHADGAVGVLLPGGLGEFGVVSQGCRPVGEPLIVTDAEANMVRGLGSRPALERLGDLYAAADGAERSLLSSGLHIGVVVDERAERFGPGDFLVRGVTGADHGAGVLRIGARAPVGTTVQFHVRDAQTARADLAQLLEGVDVDAALLFSCSNRGHRLFGEPDHDAAAVAAVADRGAVAGMSCAGEFGRVGGENHVLGSTASMLFLYG